MKLRTFFLVLIALVLIPAAARAEVRRVEITSRTDLQNGSPFGSVGPYERLMGKVYFAVDPRNPRNKLIADLDKAPRNAKGEVEFSADVSIIKPKDPARGNGAVLFDIVNRGNSVALGNFNRAERGAEYGDGFLMREGYTIVAVGWQFDVAPDAIGLDSPIATDNGKPITGWINTPWFVPNQAATSLNFPGNGVYLPVDTGSPEYRLTEREGFYGAQTVIPRDAWRFAREVDGKIVDDPRFLFLKSGFKPGLTYELRYETKDPPVAGLGFAAVRDLAASFKYGADPLVKARYTYLFGVSQTGRFVRALVHEGFTADERDREVFDALFSHIAGAAFGSFNERFAQPNDSSFYTGTAFPFRYEAERDPVTGKTDGMGARLPRNNPPKVFVTNNSTEYWGTGRSAALTHVSLDGRQDVQQPENVRIYLLASTQHGPGQLPPAEGNGQLKANSVDYRWAMRALLTSLDAWVRNGTPPPASRHPKLSDGTLVAQQTIKFPDIKGIKWPYAVGGGYRADLPGSPSSNLLPFLVPQVDRDGNEIGGIRLPEVAVPLATTTGWAFRSERVGAPGELISNAGSYIPFATTRAQREASADPRLSVAERYQSRANYLGRVEAAARRLVQERYLLAADVDAIVERAGRHWDLLMGAASSR